MTRDFNSVESRLTRLLKSTTSKRVFILFSDVLAEANDVEISWNIKIDE